ncbi:hypothetical protein PQX77_005632, partial [Marasmius sp. AFHP31]
MAFTSRVDVQSLRNLSKRLGILQFVSFLSFPELRRPFELEDFDEDFNPPCYLFVRPPPQSSDGAPDIETWLRGENLYYYSYDPEGGSAITEQECILLGLPSLISSFQMEYVHWDIEAYDFMEKWQRAKDFDYSTIDYAKSLGFPILEMTIPQDLGNFENLMGMLLSPFFRTQSINHHLHIDRGASVQRLDNELPYNPTSAYAKRSLGPGNILNTPELKKIQKATRGKYDTACVARPSPVPLFRRRVHLCSKTIHAWKDCNSDDIMVIGIDGASAYVDAKVDLNIAPAATVKAIVAVSIDIPVGLLGH